MSFAVLIGIGTAIGNVAGAAAASILPAAIGGGAAGAGGLGAMAAATTAGTAGSALAGTALAPAASTAALGNLAAAAAPSAAPAAATSSLAGAVPASSGSGITSTGIAAPGGAVSTSSPSLLGSVGDFIGQNTIGSLFGEGAKSAISPKVRAENQNAIIAQNTLDTQQQNADARELSAQVSGGLSGGLGLGGKRFAHGGGVALEEGQFIIPADVVSALGNGSTKAGAAFLDEFFGRA